MLRPFKSLLTYLQLGSPNSPSTQRRRTSTDSMEEEACDAALASNDLVLVNGINSDGSPNEMNSSSGSINGSYNNNSTDGDDPLTDPLALDQSSSDHHVDPTYSMVRTARTIVNGSELADDDDEEDDDIDAAAQIVFVDIDKLKNNVIEENVPMDAGDVSVIVPDETDTNSIVAAPVGATVRNSRPVMDQYERFKLVPMPTAPAGGPSMANANGVNTSEDGESRSDGSDSGLGSEVLGIVNSTAPEGSSHTNLHLHHHLHLHPHQYHQQPQFHQKSALKRRSMDDDGLASDSSPKKARRNVQFDNVTVYYFPRSQGFVCVPSQGGCTLGMESNHMFKRSMTLSEHASELRRAHRHQMDLMNPLQPLTTRHHSSSDDSEEDLSDVSCDSNEDSESTSGFLQPVSTKQRRALLKAAGVRKIETSEKDECRIIRSSREVCGCTCQGYCDPDTCACSLSGIKCQVDRPNFPCGCTRDQCGNVFGRVEFNQIRVRTHFIHTIMRLDLEKKQLLDQCQMQSPPGPGGDNIRARVVGSQGAGVITSTCYANANDGGGDVGDSRAVERPEVAETRLLLQSTETASIGRPSSSSDTLDFDYTYREEDYTGPSDLLTSHNNVNNNSNNCTNSHVPIKSNNTTSDNIHNHHHPLLSPQSNQEDINSTSSSCNNNNNNDIDNRTSAPPMVLESLKNHSILDALDIVPNRVVSVNCIPSGGLTATMVDANGDLDTPQVEPIRRQVEFFGPSYLSNSKDRPMSPPPEIQSVVDGHSSTVKTMPAACPRIGEPGIGIDSNQSVEGVPIEGPAAGADVHVDDVTRVE